MAATTALMVAQWFVLDAAKTAEEGAGDYMTQLRVQKLLFFAQGSYMVLKDKEKLFDDKIYHGKYGPVVTSLKPYLEKYGRSKIEEIPGIKIDFGSHKRKVESVLFFVKEVFGQFSTFELVNLTHKDPAWRNTKEREEITPEEIYKSANKLYFKDA